MDRHVSQHQASTTPFVPLSEDWERHKNRIIRLYSQRSLEEVRAVMREEFYFKASLRMYRYRLRKWNCYKHKNRRTSYQHPASPSEASSQHTSFDTSHTNDSGVFTQDSRITPAALDNVAVSHGRGEYHRMIDETSTSWTAYRHVSREGGFVDADKGTWRSSDAPQGIGTSFTTVPPLAPTMALAHVGPELRGLELIFKSIQAEVLSAACMSKPGTRPSRGHRNGTLQVALSNFWHKTGHAIYFLKVEDSKRAWKLFGKACESAITERHSSNSLTLNMLPSINEMLTTLSPTNTGICPGLRGLLLRYLVDVLIGSLGKQHPATVVAYQLQAKDSCPEVYEKASSYLLDMVIAHLGPTHPMCFKAQSSLVRTLRKNGDFEQANTVGRQLFEDVRHSLGDDALQTRQAAREIELLLMTEKKWAEALEVCFFIVGQRVENSKEIAPRYCDRYAAYTMEDIAKCYENLGDSGSRDNWLKMAYDTGTKIQSIDPLVTQHVKSKL